MDWTARIDAVRAAHQAAVGRFEQHIEEIDAAARAGLRRLGEQSRAESESAEATSGRVVREERERLLRQDAVARRGGDVFVLPTDWTEADEARWRA
ncbi:hypothetical protein GPX89_30405 [Nocardia sp. ET3-3]|uniref:Uncharacterized protein n=1 Tax=Nocardia terrae TaxID=2675851 RepID=A0A7K1V4G2_9NOCA|nr:hypothetical protein [Nocardia terrae]MVU81540.1 hypothetical protein [Nocardia terrae]